MSINKTVTVMALFFGAMLGVFSIMTGSLWGLLFASSGLGVFLIILGVTEMIMAKTRPPANPGGKN